MGPTPPPPIRTQDKMRSCIRVQARLDALKQGFAEEEALSAKVKKVSLY